MTTCISHVVSKYGAIFFPLELNMRRIPVKCAQLQTQGLVCLSISLTPAHHKEALYSVSDNQNFKKVEAQQGGTLKVS